jgi:hypothetical protein
MIFEDFFHEKIQFLVLFRGFRGKMFLMLN